MLEPVGIDRWPFELAMKYGMRDGYMCPVGGRWVVAFWSPGVLGTQLHAAGAWLALYGCQCGSGSLGKIGW